MPLTAQQLETIQAEQASVALEAQSEVRQASILLSKADIMLDHRGTGTGRILVMQAVERLEIALYHLRNCV